MRIVVALGGNALLERGEPPEAGIQLEHVRAAAAALAPLAREHQLVICHGNGPQVGLLAHESETDRALQRPYPLDVLGAQTQGMIGYWLVQSLHGFVTSSPFVCVLTRTLVDPADPAFGAPSKFIGQVYRERDARRLAHRHGWQVAPDGDGWRRVVASPEPVRVIEQPVLDRLVRDGQGVVCAGGGGVPVVADGAGTLRGVDAVVDKDLTAALLACRLDADRLLVLTDVPAVLDGFGTEHAVPIRRLDAAALDPSGFPAGSMRPKLEACRRFVTATGCPAAIGALGEAADVLDARAGTAITLAAAVAPDGG